MENILGEEEASRGPGTEDARVSWGEKGLIWGMDVHEDGWGSRESVAGEVGWGHLMLRARLSGSDSISQVLGSYHRLVSKGRNQAGLWEYTSGG